MNLTAKLTGAVTNYSFSTARTWNTQYFFQGWWPTSAGGWPR